ncbi:MAG: hypothetical protein QGH51_08715 [Planctomycetota bacterium]|nr:hypothetical protein [Planctomycetota bacterium]MDP6942090.1 hypothetical protein [Planctomycetota bacterium]
MKNIHLLLLPFLFTVACALPGDAAWSGAHINAFGGMLQSDSSGALDNLTLDQNGDITEGSLDIPSGSENVFYGGARIGFAPLEIVYSQFGVDSIHSGNMAVTGEFMGQPWNDDLAVNTTMDLQVQKLMLGLDIFNSGVVRVGLLAGVDQLGFNTFSIEAAESVGTINQGDTVSAISNEDLLVPMGGIRLDADIPITGLRFGGEYSGISIDVEDVVVDYWDLDLNLNYALTDNAELLVGYRDIDLNVEVKEGDFGMGTMDMELALTGPYAALGITF